MIQVTNLRKQFGDTEILKGISFDVPRQVDPRHHRRLGQWQNNSPALSQRLRNDQWRNDHLWQHKARGGISATDYKRRVREVRLKVGTVFQHFYLFPHLSVVGNIIEAPVHVLRTAKKSAEKEAYELLESVGLEHTARRYPESLSGGEQQRVAIARALAMHPALLLLDEPTSALDPRRIASLRGLLRGFVDKGQTMIIISHSIGFLGGVSDNLLFLEGGLVVEYGPTDSSTQLAEGSTC